MDDRLRQYLGQSLGTAGFVILEKTLAYTLRPDLWPAGIASYGGSFNGLSFEHLKAAGVRLYRATLEGRGVSQHLWLHARLMRLRSVWSGLPACV